MRNGCRHLGSSHNLCKQELLTKPWDRLVCVGSRKNIKLWNEHPVQVKKTLDGFNMYTRSIYRSA